MYPGDVHRKFKALGTNSGSIAHNNKSVVLGHKATVQVGCTALKAAATAVGTTAVAVVDILLEPTCCATA
jgi:hypothetical protein